MLHSELPGGVFENPRSLLTPSTMPTHLVLPASQSIPANRSQVGSCHIHRMQMGVSSGGGKPKHLPR